jgi:hypothetical protein
MGVSDSCLKGAQEQESLQDALKRAQFLFEGGRVKECSALLQSVHVTCGDAADRSDAAVVQSIARTNLAVLSCQTSGDTSALTECLDTAAGKIQYKLHSIYAACLMVYN